MKSYLQGAFAAKRAGIPVFVRETAISKHHGLRLKNTRIGVPGFSPPVRCCIICRERSRLICSLCVPSERLFFSPHASIHPGSGEGHARGSATFGPITLSRRDRAGTVLRELIERKRVSTDRCRSDLPARRPAVEICVAGDGPSSLTLNAAQRSRMFRRIGSASATRACYPAIYAGCDFLSAVVAHCDGGPCSQRGPGEWPAGHRL